MKMIAIYLSTDGDEKISLPNSLDLENYGCAVVEMSGEIKVFDTDGDGNQKKVKIDETLYLCCDIVEDSVLMNTKLPILRSIYVNSKNSKINKPIENLIWLNVKRPKIDHIRLYITDKTGIPVSLSKSKLECTLLFIPRK